MLTPMKRLLFAIVLLSAARTVAARGMLSETAALTETAAASAVSSASAETIASAVVSSSAETIASAVVSSSAEAVASAVSTASAETAASAVFSVSAGVPAAAASPAASAAVAALAPSADGRAAEILEKLAAGFRALGAYGVAFEVSSDEYTTRGRYAVEGENYYIAVGEAEVYCDGKIRYEIDNRRREVTIDDVDTSSRNLLSNPAHAFDFIGTQYAPSLVSDAEGRAVVRLTPTSADASPAGEILVTVDTAAMRPESLRYDYDGEQVGIAVLGVAPLDTPLKAFSKGDYKGYEFIDFR